MDANDLPLSYSIPLSRDLDFKLDSNGHVFLTAYDDRSSLHILPEEFCALFELLREEGLGSRIASVACHKQGVTS